MMNRITIELDDLFQMAEHRPAGYVRDVLSRAVSVTPTHYTLTVKDYHELRNKYAEPIGRRPRPTAKMIKSYGVALAGGAYVSAEVQAEREATCRQCDQMRTDEQGPWCAACGCAVGGNVQRVRNLSAYVEKLDPLTTVTIAGVPIGRGVTWGCKHPHRAEGKGWRR